MTEDEPRELADAADITDLTRAEEIRLRYAAIVESSDDAIIARTLDGVISAWNAAAERMFGYTEHEVIGQPITMIIPPDLYDEEDDILRRLRAGERVEHYETVRLTKAGELIDVSLTISLLRDPAGRIIGYSKIARDITKARQAEAALRHSEQQLAREVAGAKTLQSISTRLISESTPESLYAQILDAAIELMASDAASVQMLAADDTSLRLLAWRNFHPDSAAFWQRVEVGAGSTCSKALRNNERIVVADIEACEFMAGTQDQQEYRRSGIRAVQSTPLQSRSGRPLGMLSTHWRTPHDPTEEDFRFFDVLARQAADLIERTLAEQALREGDERFRLAMHNVAAGVYTLDLNGLVTYVNPAAEAMFGWTNAELLGRKMHDVTHYKHPDGSSFPASECPGLEVLQTGVELQEVEDMFIRRDGSFLPVVHSASPLRTEGRTVGLVVVLRDDTLRREAERAVRKSEERFRSMADAAPVMVWMSGPDGLSTYSNRRSLEFTGRPIEAELGNGWLDSVHPDDITRCMEIYTEAFEQHQPFKMELRLRRHDGEYRWILSSGVPALNPDGSFAGYIGSAVDITDQKLAAEALSSLSRNLMEAQEKERAWIARELHDDLGQRVAGLVMQLHSCAQVLLNGTSERARVLQVSDQATALAHGIQAISHRLHPAQLQHLGLASAAAGLCQELSELHNVEIVFSHSGVSTNLSKDIALCLFRVLQEALNNAIRHAGARQFRVTLRGTPTEIQQEVIDMGRGFDPKAVIGRGLGLIGMQERLSLVRGEVFIESRPGGGTTIRARVNL